MFAWEAVTILPPPSALHIASTQHTSRRDFCRYVTRTLFMDKWLFVCGIPQKYKLLYILNIKSCGSKLWGNNLQLQDLCWICPFCDKTTFWCGMRPIRCRKKIENWKIYRICQVLYVTKQPFVYEMKPYCKWSPRVQSSKICIMHTCWVLGGSSAARVLACICSIRQCRMATRASNEGPHGEGPH